jgi:hypothetical protein
MVAVIGESDQFRTLPSGRIRKMNKNGIDGSAGLAREIAMLPTPQTMDFMEPKTPKAINKEMNETRPGRTNFANLKEVIPYGQELQTGTKTGLKLQPAFVEWMMGYPSNYTSLED